MNEIPVVSYEFNSESVSILPIGDLHLGAMNCYLDDLINTVETFKESKIVILGDIINNSTKHSVGNVYEDSLSPSQAIKLFRDKFLMPYRDRILCFILGNHENRSLKDVDDSTLENICHLLDIPFSKDVMVLDISVKGKTGIGKKRRTNYSIALAHGFTGGRFIEKSARQARYFQSFIEGIDCYISAHTHTPTVIPTAIWHYDPHNKKVIKTIKQHVIISSWAEDRYALQKAFPPSPVVATQIILHAGKKKNIEIREMSK
jgi:hypothetical protein